MDLLRRTLLKGVATTALAGLLASGSLRPVCAGTAVWNAAAFEADTPGAAIAAIGADAATQHADLVIHAPDYADNGHSVSLDVVSHIPGTTSIAIVVRENHYPLSALFEFGPTALPEASMRLRFAEDSVVHAFATAHGKVYSASKKVHILFGGCDH